MKLVKPLRRELERVPTARGAVQELFKSDPGYGSRKDRQVWLRDENVELVAGNVRINEKFCEVRFQCSFRYDLFGVRLDSQDRFVKVKV